MTNQKFALLDADNVHHFDLTASDCMRKVLTRDGKKCSVVFENTDADNPNRGYWHIQGSHAQFEGGFSPIMSFARTHIEAVQELALLFCEHIESRAYVITPQH